MASGDRKKRICFVATYTYALFHRDTGGFPITGLDVQLYNWAIAFARDDEYDVHFVVGDFGQGEREVIDGVVLWKSLVPKRRGMLDWGGSFFSLYRLFRKIDADVYIDRGASGPISFGIGVLSKILRKKFIHMVASDGDVSGEYQKKSSSPEAILHSLALRMANGVTFQNSFQKSILEKWRIKSWKIQNSFPIKEITNTDRHSILWIGSSYSLKQPEIFLDLARRFPQEDFVLILQKHDEVIFPKIKREAQNMENVRFIPGVPFHGVEEFFEEAKLFVNTSSYEGFPNTFIQSAIFSVPILSLNVDPDNILVEYNFGIFCKNDRDVLVEELGRLLKDEERRKGMADNARSFARQRFDVSINIDSFKQILSEVLCS